MSVVPRQGQILPEGMTARRLVVETGLWTRVVRQTTVKGSLAPSCVRPFAA